MNITNNAVCANTMPQTAHYSAIEEEPFTTWLAPCSKNFDPVFSDEENYILKIEFFAKELCLRLRFRYYVADDAEAQIEVQDAIERFYRGAIDGNDQRLTSAFVEIFKNADPDVAALFNAKKYDQVGLDYFDESSHFNKNEYHEFNYTVVPSFTPFWRRDPDYRRLMCNGIPVSD